MPTEQYHEPPGELPADVRTRSRVLTSLIEEAEDEADRGPARRRRGGSRAGLLYLPYLAWSSYALALDVAIRRRNRG